MLINPLGGYGSFNTRGISILKKMMQRCMKGPGPVVKHMREDKEEPRNPVSNSFKTRRTWDLGGKAMGKGLERLHFCSCVNKFNLVSLVHLNQRPTIFLDIAS